METGELELTKVSSKGQIVLPKDIRKKLKISQGTTIAVSVSDGLIVLKLLESKLLKDDLKTLKEVKNAWEEIEAGKVKTASAKEFLKDLKGW